MKPKTLGRTEVTRHRENERLRAAPQRVRLRLRRLSHVITVLASGLLIAPTACAQVDEEEVPADVRAQAVRFEIHESQFDRWVFQNWQTAQAARTQLEKLLGLHIDDVDRAGQLNEAQRRKVQVAGAGDIKRFFERVEVARSKFNLVRKDQQKLNEVFQEIQPLQLTLAAGLFDESSLFYKALRRTLTGEQAKRYEQAERERRAFRYRAKVELTVAMLENALPLRDAQRQAFVELLIAETKPPQKSGQQDHYVILWQASGLPEGMLKPLFDEIQWKLLQRHFQQIRGMEQWLRQNGGLTLEGNDDAGEGVESPRQSSNIE
jgi:hypothetical protein